MLQLPSSGLEYILEKKTPPFLFILFFLFLLLSTKSETGVHFAQGHAGQIVLKTRLTAGTTRSFLRFFLIPEPLISQQLFRTLFFFFLQFHH